MEQDDKFKFTELNQKSSKELFFLFYNSIIMEEIETLKSEVGGYTHENCNH